MHQHFVFVFVLITLFFSDSLQQCPPTESFENGYNEWTLVDFVSPLHAAVISTSGQSSGFGFFTSQPTDGTHSFQNGFDASTPSNLTLTKTLTIGSTIQFDYRYAWDLTSYCSEDCRPRFFIVNFYSTSGVLLQSNQILQTTYTVVSDSGIQTATVDTSLLNGQTAQMQFVWVVPQSSTGPAFFELDNIRFSCAPAFNCTPSCQNGGTCVDTNTCNCPANFTGSVCEQRIATPSLPFIATGECPSMASSNASFPLTFSDPIPYGYYLIGARFSLNVTTFCTNANITATLNGISIGSQDIGPLCNCSSEEVVFDVFLDHWNSSYYYGKDNNTLVIKGDNIAWINPVLDIYVSDTGCPDGIGPTINVCPSPVTLTTSSVSCNAAFPDFASLSEGVDQCGIVFITQNQTIGSPGVHSVEVTFSDYYGASSTCITEVTVVDTTVPSISCPDPITISADGTCQAILPSLLSGVNVSDSCSVSTSQNPLASSILPYGLSYVNMTASDPSGNIASCQIAVNVIDDTNPTVTCPSDLTISACGYTTENFTSQLTFSDNCGISTLSQSPDVGHYLNLGSHQVNITLIDISGNQASCTFNIHIVDSVAPTLFCDTPFVLPVDANCQVPLPNVTGSVSAQDNCILYLTQDPAPNSQLFSVGNYSLNITASDLQGNTETCEKQVQVVDDIIPMVQCTAELTVQVDALCQAPIPSILADVTSSDNCGIAQIIQSPPAGVPVTSGNYTITVTASDYFNNEANCDTIVHIVDITFPTITCPASIVINANEVCQTPFPDFMTLSAASDNCGFTLSQYPDVGTPLGLGEHLVTVRVTDLYGNFQECNSSVIVVDTSVPVLPNCVPARIHQRTDCDSDQALSEIPSFIVDGLELAYDNCNLTQVTQDPLPGTKVPFGSYNITLTFIDASGNVMSCMTNYTYEEEDSSNSKNGLSQETVIGVATGVSAGMSLCGIAVFIMYYKNMSPKLSRPNLKNPLTLPNAQDIQDKVQDEIQGKIEDRMEKGKKKKKKKEVPIPVADAVDQPVIVAPMGVPQYGSGSDRESDQEDIDSISGSKLGSHMMSQTTASLETPDLSESE